jgi:hypothetical protein
VPEYAKTSPELASAVGVARQTVTEWKRDPSFPAPTEGGWDCEEVREWAKRNGKGPYRRIAAASVGDDGGEGDEGGAVTLADAKLRLTIEQSENERIKKERQLVEQAAELGEIVFASDVLSFHARMIATVTAVHDALIDAVDRAIPDGTDHKSRVLEICGKLKADCFAAMEETV